MLLLSYERIEAQKEAINKINVFPVPDQDTGTNIAKTLEGIKEAVAKKNYKDIEELKKDTLEALLNSAQGNSGIIYAGFLVGFFGEINNTLSISGELLCRALRAGSDKARASIAEPKEGTMLDVTDAAAIACQTNQNLPEMKDIFQEIITVCKQALLDTQEKMPLLKKAGVVDAGGMAFLIILEAYYDVIAGNATSVSGVVEESASTEVKKFIQTLAEKYELVVLIDKVKQNTEKIREKLKELGTSIDIVQIGDRVKIHIHTNEPKDCKREMAKLGDIISIREEDLLKETTGQPSLRRQDIGIVTDSLADLTDKIMERYSIEMVNLKWEWVLDKKVEGENLYQKMRNAFSQLTPANSPKTSQPTPREYVDAYKRQLQKFQHVLYLSFSKKLSGSYNSGIQAKEHLQNGERSRIYVLDTQEGTGAQALMVLRAIELIQSQFDIREVIAELEKIHQESRVRVIAVVESPVWLEFGGRINSRKAALLKFLQKLSITPILTMKHGLIEQFGMSFGTKDQAKILCSKFLSEIGSKLKAGHKVRAVITHCDNPEAAQKLKTMVKAAGVEVSFTNLMYPIVGSHLGPGTLTLSYMVLD